MLNHPLIKSLAALRGNPKACVLTEPLWGIPYQLYAPYVSLYMLNLGLKDSQIGMLISVGLVVQIFSALLSGPITDKFGRRKTTFIGDVLVWSGCTFIYAIAQDFRYFLAGAIVMGFWRVTTTSWSCLMVEEADPALLVDIYAWVYIAGQLSAFFAPIAGLLISKFTLVPTMRILYWFAFVLMTAKFILLYVNSTETQQGKIRMEETRHQSLFSLMTGYGDVIRQILRTPRTLYTLGIMVAMSTATTINNSFWSILVTRRINIPESSLALFPFVRSSIMIVFFFLAMPKIKEMRFRNPMLVGLSGLIASQLLLVSMPEKSYVLLLLSTLIEACCYATVSTQVDRLTVVTVDAQERARISALLFLGVIAFTTPFGWIAGQLSEMNRILPFLLNICLYALGFILVFLAARQASIEDHQAGSRPLDVAGEA